MAIIGEVFTRSEEFLQGKGELRGLRYYTRGFFYDKAPLRADAKTTGQIELVETLAQDLGSNDTEKDKFSKLKDEFKDKDLEAIDDRQLFFKTMYYHFVCCQQQYHVYLTKKSLFHLNKMLVQGRVYVTQHDAQNQPVPYDLSLNSAVVKRCSRLFSKNGA